jgi:hypothetical protein
MSAPDELQQLLTAKDYQSYIEAEK